MIRASQLKLANPCPLPDDVIEGQCDHCQTHVHALSSMTEAQARAFLRAHVGQRLCLSYQVAPGGRVRFRSPPHPVRDAVAAVCTAALMGCAAWGPDEMLTSPEEIAVCEQSEHAGLCEWTLPPPNDNEGCDARDTMAISTLDTVAPPSRGTVAAIELVPPE